MTHSAGERADTHAVAGSPPVSEAASGCADLQRDLRMTASCLDHRAIGRRGTGASNGFVCVGKRLQVRVQRN